MPMIIPVVVALAAASTGAVVGFAAFAGIAGSMMVAMGTVMGDKDLVKIGAIVGVVGGISGFANSASSGASATGAADAGAGAGAAEAVDAGAQISDWAPAADVTGTVDSGATNLFAGAENSTSPPSYGTSIAEQAAAASTAPSTNSASLADSFAAKSGLAAPDAGTSGLTPSQANYNQLEQTTQIPTTPLEKAASGYGASDLEAWWQKAKAAGKDVGGFLEKNKTLVKIGGDMLQSMYGPEAESLDYQKSLMERARRNINAPVVLKYNGSK